MTAIAPRPPRPSPVSSAKRARLAKQASCEHLATVTQPNSHGVKRSTCVSCRLVIPTIPD